MKARAEGARIGERLLAIAKKTFKPEFVNRVDDIIVFSKLDKKDLLEIVDIEIAKLAARLGERKLAFTVDPEVKEFLITKGYEPEFGARPLRRSVERWIEDQLAEELLRNRFAGAKGIRVSVDDGKIVFTPEKPRRK